jgi:hypothetical protein
VFDLPEDPKQRARVWKQLDKLYNFYGKGVMSLGAFLRTYGVHHKTVEIRNHAVHKTQGEYKTTRDIRTYTLWQDERTGVDVPKLVYDLIDAPEKIRDRRF